MTRIVFRRFVRIHSALLLLVAAQGAPLASQEQQPSGRPESNRPAPDRSAWESGWHVVRPGDTLEGLAERFLGSSRLWNELHGLNPFVDDPDLLFPGQRLRIFLERPTPEPSAQVMSTERKVSELPRPAPWRPASVGDVLLEKDGLRTEKSASARLLFDDGASLTLSEDSLVFIRRQTRSSAPSPRKEIEIQVGQADVESSPAVERADTIEIVVGGARAVGVGGDGKALKARSRRSETSAAQFMIYDGAGTVAAAGKKVDVPAGSGTTVEPKAPPAPPEPLLPAPTGLEPGPGGEFDRSEPRLAWQAVPGAASYVIEICRDASCGAVVEIVRGVVGLSTSPKENLNGPLFWRVTAVAPSGLDGFPSPTQAMTAVESVAPPAPALALRSASGGLVSSRSCVAAVPALEVRAVDRSGTPLAWDLVVDGQAMTAERFSRLPLAGTHEIAARATDARGRGSLSAPVQFTLDGASPWAELIATPGETAVEEGKPKRRRARKEAEPPAACDSRLEILTGAGSRPVPCSTVAGGEPLSLALSGERQEIELRGSGPPFSIGGVELASGESIRLAAWDVGCGLSAARIAIGPSSYVPGRLSLRIEIEDGAGNRRAHDWHLRGRPSR